MSARRFDFDTAEGREEVDLNGLIGALGRHRGLIARATLGAAAAAFMFCLFSTPRYLAEARILIENQESYFTSAAPEGTREPDATPSLDTEAINSQIQLLTSRDLARKAIQKLGLTGNSEFDPDASFLATLKRPLSLFGLGRSRPDNSPDDRLINNFIDHLTVMSPSKTRVIQIEFTSRDPDLAARAANVVADLFVDLKSQAKREDAHQAAQALKPLIVSLETRVAEADAKVETFRARTGLYENAENASVPTQQLGEIATRLAEARAQQSDAEAKARSLRGLLKQGRLADAPDVSSNDLVRRIAEQRMAVRSQLAVESRTLLPAHPRIKELEAQLSDLETQLRAAVEKAARGLDNDAQVAGARVANLSALLDEQKSAVGASNADAAQLRELQRDEKILKDQLASLAAKYQAAVARDVADSAPPDARIISRALAPSQPVFPKTVPITVFGALAGLFFSTVFVLAREMTGERARLAAEAAPESKAAPALKAGLASEPARQSGASSLSAAADQSLSFAELRKALSDAHGETDVGAVKDEGMFGRLKRSVAEFAAPAIPLAPEAEPEAPASRGADEPVEAVRSEPAAPVALRSAPKPESARAPDFPDAKPAEAAPLGGSPARAASRVASQALVGRIAAAGSAAGGGAKVLVISDFESTAACASLTLARAMAREGRAILVQIDPSDAALSAALDRADGRDAFDEPQAGLAQLLLGETSFAEAIYRDGASRLHIIQSGGRLIDDSGDLDLILDALQSTYDFVLVASGESPEAAVIAGDADLTVIFAENSRARDFLHDDFAAAGARAIVLAGVDSLGEIAEMAA